MKEITPGNSYHTPERKIPWFIKACPGFHFYRRILHIVFEASSDGKNGKMDNVQWNYHSIQTLRAAETVGAKFHIENMNVFKQLHEPCIFIGNHMSTLETFVLACIISPHMNMSFVVKRSLIEYPVFKNVMISLNPIVVGRENPKEDFKAVINGGIERLSNDISIVLFPQTTRTVKFDPSAFNSIGIKLAKRAKVPVVPLALKTNFWGNGRILKECGKIDPSQDIRFEFGEPMKIQGNGRAEHERIARFISEKLEEWT